MALAVDGLLRERDRRGGLEAHAYHHRLAVGDAALYASRAVARGARAPVRSRDEGVVVLAPGHERSGEAAPDLEALRRREGQERPGELGLEFVEERVPRGPR